MTYNSQLNNQKNSGRINNKQIVLWQKLIRLVVAALYVVCEMQLGQLPDDVKIGGKKDNVNTKPE